MSENINSDELVHAKEMKRQWLEAFGDDEFIRKMYQLGFIHGWRDVKSVERLNGTDELAVGQQDGKPE